jgi:hypothetical protein
VQAGLARKLALRQEPIDASSSEILGKSHLALSITCHHYDIVKMIESYINVFM